MFLLKHSSSINGKIVNIYWILAKFEYWNDVEDLFRRFARTGLKHSTRLFDHFQPSPHSRLFNPSCHLCILNNDVLRAYCTVYWVHIVIVYLYIQYGVHVYILYSVLCKYCTVYCVHNVQCNVYKLYTVYCMHTVKCTVYILSSVMCTILFSVLCTYRTVYCVHTIQCTVYIL